MKNKNMIFLLTLLPILTTSTVIINKPYKNLKIINSWNSIVKDRELVQCYINQEFKGATSPCSKPSIKEDQGRKLREMLRQASNCPACRRTQYKDQIVECRSAISGMFKEFLHYEMTSHQEKQAFLTLITSFAHYVLLLKEFKEDGRIPTDPKAKIQDIIEDEIFNLKRKGTGILASKTFHIPQPNGDIIHYSTQMNGNSGVKLETPAVVEHPCDTKTRLDNQAKHLDNQAQTVIDKYDDPVLSQNMEKQGKLIKVVPRQGGKPGFHKYSFRFQDIDEKIAKMKKINSPYHSTGANSGQKVPALNDVKQSKFSYLKEAINK